jgi:hypothetical protein
MSQARFRQITRLQRLAQPYIKQRRQIEGEWQKVREGAAAHAAILAFLIRYGSPKIGEPLSNAWQRLRDSDAWKDCWDRFPVTLCDWDTQITVEPYSRGYVSLLGQFVRHAVISNFPGADEKQKLNAVFSSAPPWLIWFTFADYTAKLLKLKLPDLSDVRVFERSKENFDCWWGLPSGAFERRSWSYGPDAEPLSRTDLTLLGPPRSSGATYKTSREIRRRRAAHMKSPPTNQKDDWPDLIAVEILQEARRGALLRRFRA